MPGRPGEIRLPDGRRLAYLEFGPAVGRALVYCHGYPGSALEAELIAAAADRDGVRLIAPDRPGYGRSSGRSGRRLLDWPDDLEQLVDALGVERFAIVGASGGGPFAVAAAHRLPGRITRLGLVCALGPAHEAGQRRCMHPFLRFGLGLAARSELATRALWWLVALPLRIAPRVVTAAGRHLIRNRADRAVLRTHRDLFDRVLVAAFAQRGRGGLEDLRIYARPWGFELEEVAVESFLWHGESDPIVPAAFGRTLAERLPGCTARFVAGGGHQSLAVALADEVVGTLR